MYFPAKRKKELWEEKKVKHIQILVCGAVLPTQNDSSRTMLAALVCAMGPGRR